MPEDARTPTPASALDPSERTPSYVVLKRLHATLMEDAPNFKDCWELIQEIETANADAAVREAAGDVEGEYVPIPARSFRPRIVKVETTKVVKVT